MEQVNQTINNATSSTIQQYETPTRSTHTVGFVNQNTNNFPQFISQNYNNCRGATHGDTMRNLSKQYKNN